MYVSGKLQWNDKLRLGCRPQDIWLGVAEDATAGRVAPPTEPWQHVVTVADLRPDQVRSECLLRPFLSPKPLRYDPEVDPYPNVVSRWYLTPTVTLTSCMPGAGISSLARAFNVVHGCTGARFEGCATLWRSPKQPVPLR